ncbi:hypothetical protein CCMSSC00406_0004349 [Pleurotus cornucopiae]|uniref:Uncharacterized protein n=1 Tax=Pleurotus cornucopiae TaxID=5321 RepID=A0ACB7J185_PLECO|nr:hypothetical protein CCMSSC00406_0004349 [Pleurotus cornucopiae]
MAASMQVTPTTQQRSNNFVKVLYQIFTRAPVPREVKQPPICLELGEDLPQDLRGKIKFEKGHIGRGGYGKVFKGIYKLARGKKITVAIKFLELQSGPNMAAKVAEYLRRETLVWGRLKHPHILDLIGICSGLDNPMSLVPALVSPYCPHGNLKQYLEGKPPIQRLPLACQVASAVHYIHGKDVIHGDIKPENILIDEHCRPLLCDFGRSRIVGVDGFDTTLASSHHYTAPELLSYEEDVVPLTKPADIFSLTITLLLIVTDLRPFHPKKGPVIIRLFLNGKVPAPVADYAECEEMSQDLWDLFDKGWSQNPANRPNADEYMQELESIPSRPKRPLQIVSGAEDSR